MNNPALAGKVVLITGANTGIGRVTARELARQGAHVFIACRQQERCREVLAEIAAQGGKAEWLALDLTNLASVRQCAEQFLARQLPLHILINNAGVAGGHGLTASGFELAFGTNHIGHFLLTDLLRARLVASAPARIITVSSRGPTAAQRASIGPLCSNRPKAPLACLNTVFRNWPTSCLLPNWHGNSLAAGSLATRCIRV